MRRLVYDIAVSVDGFIADERGGFDGFLFEGDHVEAYQQRLAGYDTVLMGRSTYEAGYAFGMKPGERPYPHMRHIVFSRSLELPADSAVEIEMPRDAEFVEALKKEDGSDIYVCGGGKFASWLAEAGLLDMLILKMNPVVLGAGTPLFSSSVAGLKALDSYRYESGVILLRYAISSSTSTER